MNAWNLYRERGPEALWERALGFMDLDVEQTLDMQRRLMSEHLARVTTAPLWELTFGAARPRTLEELREQVPLTTYADYRETLGERRADLLHEPPEFWVKTSGRSGGPDKWVPMPRSFVDELAWVDIGLLLVYYRRIFSANIPQSPDSAGGFCDCRRHGQRCPGRPGCSRRYRDYRCCLGRGRRYI